MTATLTHSASLAGASERAKPSVSWFAKIVSAFWLTLDIIAESREEERSAHARLPFTDW
jgi:hypothetical protein